MERPPPQTTVFLKTTNLLTVKTYNNENNNF